MAEPAPQGPSAEELEWEQRMATESGPLDMEQAYSALKLPMEKWGKLEEVKAAYRQLSVKWHPDKNPKNPDKAKAIFVRISAAYQTLTTNNFDYQRWKEAFVVPPMQSLEDVLLLAMKGADPFVIDSMLRARGDYRPHQEFGIDLAVPWSAGTQEKPSWEVVGAKYSRTRALEGGGAKVSGEIAWLGDDGGAGVARAQVAGASAARPWERVGGSGWEDAEPEADRYTPVPGRPDLRPDSAEAPAAAEELNDRGMAFFEQKRFREALDCYGEAARLQPGKGAFHGNRAAAALKLGRHREAREAAEAAVALDAGNARYQTRLGQALTALGSAAGQRGKAELKAAVAAFKRALKADPSSGAAKKGLKEAGIAFMAEFDDDLSSDDGGSSERD